MASPRLHLFKEIIFMTENTAPKTIYLKDYTVSDYLVESVDLHYALKDDATEVTSTVHYFKNPQSQTNNAPLILNGHDLELISVKLNGSLLDKNKYTLTPDTLEIAQVPNKFTLEITTKINPQQNTSLEGLYWVNGLYCTQCEAQGFRKMTYYLDRPDVMAKFTTTITADKNKYPVLLSNGNCIKQGDLSNNQHFVTWQDPFKKPCYLFALVAGDLVELTDKFTTMSGRNVTIKIFVEKGNLDKCDYAMGAIKRTMRWDEQRFGREYDLDIFMVVAVHDFNMGAMENKGLNIFNAKYILAKPETATDDDYIAIERVIAHEYFHNWTGNRITCRDWFQLSLKESLTMFRDAEFSADMTSRPVVRIGDANVLRSVQFPQDASPMAHPVKPESYIEINNFYTVTVYNKGAEVIRMLQTLFGVDGFRKGMDLYFERFDGQAVTTDDFVQAIADANQFNPTQFKRWYSQAGTPELSFEDHYDYQQKTYTLTVKQICPATPGQPHKEPFYIPLAVGLLNTNGHDFPLQLMDDKKQSTQTTRVLSMTQAEQIFIFNNIDARPIPSLLRDFSAPVKINYNYSDADLQFLLAHDSDPFARWNAGQQLSIRIIKRLINDYQQKKPLQLDKGYVEAWRSILNDKSIDKSFTALLLKQPSEMYLTELMDTIDVESIVAVRHFIPRELTKQLREEFLQIYHENYNNKPYEYNETAIGERSLKNSCLAYLMTLDDADAQQLALKQLKEANNMTDEIAALYALSNSTTPEREQALQDFYNKWQHDTLVIDKWFSILARSELPDTFIKVKSLLNHPAFNIKNPNKVRALIGAFVNGNMRNFHIAGGEPYQFLADQIIILNKVNPMIAARLIEPFTRWRKFDTQRQTLMKQQLERIKQTPQLTKDIFEVVTKTLASE